MSMMVGAAWQGLPAAQATGQHGAGDLSSVGPPARPDLEVFESLLKATIPAFGAVEILSFFQRCFGTHCAAAPASHVLSQIPN
jgi:hypothetical protein